MTPTEILLVQTKEAHQWTLKLINSIPDDKWLTLPPIIESNIHWQVGHLIITHFYHNIVCLKTPQQDVFTLIPIMDYYPVFTAGGHAKSESIITAAELKQNLDKVQSKALSIIEQLDEKDLRSELFPTQFPHPIAKTKFEALSWNIQHTMWHCGQIALIKRVVDKPFSFDES